MLWASERRNPDETSAEAIKADTIRKYEKKPVLISHLNQIREKLNNGGNKATAITAVSLVAFWGLARLGELVSDKPGKTIPKLKDSFRISKKEKDGYCRRRK